MLTDKDLLLLENLTYCMDGNNVASSNHLKSLTDCRTVGEFLNQFNEEILSQMDKQTGQTYGIDSGSEWAAMIRCLKSKTEICDLKIVDPTGKTNNAKAICFVDPHDNNKAIVAFVGTKGGEEWQDNVEGLNQADTQYQLEAYDYVESLPYDHITVVGHSKGGNKAQYVAIRSDKVDRCVSYDGQGFSQEFIDKYSDRINKNASKITCYSLSCDYVHILMFPIPGAKQIYIDGGSDVSSFIENHSADAAFEYYQDSEGKWHIRVDANGEPRMDFVAENADMAILHRFICFFMQNASEEEKQEIVNLLGPLLKGIFGEGWSSEQIGEYLAQHTDELITLVSYLLHYIKLNGLTKEDLVRILDVFGLNLYEIVFSLVKNATGIELSQWALEKLVDYTLDALTNGEDDGFVKWLVETLGKDGGAVITAYWKKIEDKYNSIHPTNNTGNYTIKVRDYSKKTYTILENAMNRYMQNTLPNVSSWNAFAGESWFGKLLIGLAVNIVNGYANKVIETNRICKERMDKIFDNIQKVDRKYGRSLSSTGATVTWLDTQIKQRK